MKHRVTKYNSFLTLAESRSVDLSRIGVVISCINGRWSWSCKNGLDSQRTFATMRECRDDAINALE